MTLELDGVRRTFAGGVAALRGISARLPGDAYSCIMGASGSGKTTLLRIIAGLERADAGRVLLAGTPIDARPPEQRPIHTVAQDGALFPHLDALANVGFAPRLRGLRGRELEARATASLEAVGLVDPALYRRRPHALSGGERQRVALARALAGDPEVILLDEPLAALDRPLRAALRRTLRDTRRARRLCFVHVTHDPEEALALADHLLVLADGAAIAEGPPAQLYARPPSLAAARLLGGLSPIPGSKPRWIRPERLRVAVDGSGVDGEVVDASLLGGRWELLVRAGPVTLTAQSAAAAPIGARVRVSWDPGDELDFSGELGEADG